MIACSCGGFTVGRQAKCGAHVLKWEACGSCGRCDAWRLHSEGGLLAHGQDARRRFLSEQAAKRSANGERVTKTSNP